jgi:MFS family permease
MFIAARGIIGFGLGFNITAAPILIMELAFPTQKAPMVSIYNSLWSLGAIVAAWTTYGTIGRGEFHLYSRHSPALSKSFAFGGLLNRRDGSLAKIAAMRRRR